ncbi:MAG: hypothetical protein A2W76_00825 [Gammaproteobacteria bacterium RIFCSPLOWO2_12_47_11]|nr:MAG: hypothetical protein A2W76_00825 [Gammaproteobacteria bacterium RIFCSPLOWO2_12_47_11]OGT82745.1 MAG: hypothetical protein A3G42_04580 [Gammaproteobacteria bacterium RIFCSPLOWO2_12_FULL_47_76]
MRLILVKIFRIQTHEEIVAKIQQFLHFSLNFCCFIIKKGLYRPASCCIFLPVFNKRRLISTRLGQLTGCQGRKQAGEIDFKFLEMLSLFILF